jgi:hypothetical protein
MPECLRFVSHCRARRPFHLLVLLLVALSLAACGGQMTTDRAYGEIKPKQQLPERELRNLPENLLIKIDNVADAGKSYRNYVVLFINGREIAPSEKVTNISSTYSYPMRLQHGLYEVKAEYHVVGFWREQVYEIKTDEPVKIMPDTRTILAATLDKDHRGRPVRDKLRFRLSYEKMFAQAPVDRVAPIETAPQERPIVIQPAPIPQTREGVIIAPRREAQPRIERTPQPVPVPELRQPIITPEPDELTVLQINTSPSGADVIVDDRFYGQSPIKIAVTKDQNHVIQIARKGYNEVVKVLDATDLQRETLVQLLLKLEPTAEAKEQ